MKNLFNRPRGKAAGKERPDYYLTPTRDFTKHTKDCTEKYWNKETAFDWGQSVGDNLKKHLENLDDEDLSRVAFMTLPMIADTLERKIIQIRQSKLPVDEDALKAIAECVPFDKGAIQQAIVIQKPLKDLQSSIRKLKDQIEILQSELLDLREQQRLGLFKKEAVVKRLENETQRKEQQGELSHLSDQLRRLQEECRRLETQSKVEEKRLKTKIREEFQPVEQEVLTDLEDTLALLQQTIKSKQLPEDPQDRSRLEDLILKRQLRGLKDIANHALVVEQSAIAPLTMGIVHYQRYREIQEAMTTFINDEAKHSATFRRFLVEKLEAKEYISDILIKGAQRYMWLARFMPGVGLFMAVIVEAIGAAYLEFFGEERYMPDRLFCSICKTISMQDEKRHMDLCVDMYNELFRTGRRWERVRNTMALNVLMKSVYGDKSDDHHLIQAFRAFGVESETLYRHISTRLSHQLTRISLYVEPQRLLEIIGRKQ